MNEPTNRNSNGATASNRDVDRLTTLQANEEIECEYYSKELPDENEVDCLNCELAEECYAEYLEEVKNV